MEPTQKKCDITRCCACILTTVGSIFLTLWLTTLHANLPKCYVHSLYLPSLNRTLFHNHNHSNINNDTIFFTLKLSNSNKENGVQYDAVRVSFGLFVADNATLPIANATLEGFYQGYGKTALKSGSAEGTGGGLNRTAADGGGGGGGVRVFLRVEMATEVKHKNVMWYSKRHRLWGGANVEVNESTGEKVNPKDVRLRNVPARVGSGAAKACGVRILVSLSLALSLCVYLS